MLPTPTPSAGRPSFTGRLSTDSGQGHPLPRFSQIFSRNVGRLTGSVRLPRRGTALPLHSNCNPPLLVETHALLRIVLPSPNIMKSILLVAVVAIATLLFTPLSAASAPTTFGKCAVQVRSVTGPGVGGGFMPLGTMGAACDDGCNPVGNFCVGGGVHTTPGGNQFVSNRLAAKCFMQSQQVAQGNPNIVFQLRCTNCVGTPPAWDDPVFG